MLGFILWWGCYVVSHASFCLPQPLWLPLLQECRCAAQQSNSSAPSAWVEVWKSYCIHSASKTWIIISIKNWYKELKNQYIIWQQSIAIYLPYTDTDSIDIFLHPYYWVPRLLFTERTIAKSWPGDGGKDGSPLGLQKSGFLGAITNFGHRKQDRLIGKFHWYGPMECLLHVSVSNADFDVSNC